jgi:hypothetical protein
MLLQDEPTRLMNISSESVTLISARQAPIMPESMKSSINHYSSFDLVLDIQRAEERSANLSYLHLVARIT